MPAIPTNLVVALPAEAKPIVSRFELQRTQPDFGFPLYRRGHMALIVTGPGKVNAAAGTAVLGALGNCPSEAIWINLGIAGHAEQCVGEVLIADSIRDAGSGRAWHPRLPEDWRSPADGLLTLDQPDMDYRHAGLVDMEASGFFPTACRRSPVELVQVLKVVSDNPSSSPRGLGAKQVSLLMVRTLGPLEALLASLTVLVMEGRGSLGKRGVD